MSCKETCPHITYLEDKIAELNYSLSKVQGIAKMLQNNRLQAINDARRAGYNEAEKEWKFAFVHAKEVEKLRQEENFRFTEEIIKLEEEINILKEYKHGYEDLYA